MKGELHSTTKLKAVNLRQHDVRNRRQALCHQPVGRVDRYLANLSSWSRRRVVVGPLRLRSSALEYKLGV